MRARVCRRVGRGARGGPAPLLAGCPNRSPCWQGPAPGLTWVRSPVAPFAPGHPVMAQPEPRRALRLLSPCLAGVVAERGTGTGSDGEPKNAEARRAQRGNRSRGRREALQPADHLGAASESVSASSAPLRLFLRLSHLLRCPKRKPGARLDSQSTRRGGENKERGAPFRPRPTLLIAPLGPPPQRGVDPGTRAVVN
jgi:hypothetical protein